MPGLRLPGVRAKGIPSVLLLWEACTSHHYPEDKGARTRPPDRLRQPSSCDPAVCTGWGAGAVKTPHTSHICTTPQPYNIHTLHHTYCATPHSYAIYPTHAPPHTHTTPHIPPIWPAHRPTHITHAHSTHAADTSHTLQFPHQKCHVQGLSPADTSLLPTNPRPATLSHVQARGLSQGWEQNTARLPRS